jgi:hypothetical protein
MIWLHNRPRAKFSVQVFLLLVAIMFYSGCKSVQAASLNDAIANIVSEQKTIVASFMQYLYCNVSELVGKGA